MLPGSKGAPGYPRPSAARASSPQNERVDGPVVSEPFCPPAGCGALTARHAQRRGRNWGQGSKLGSETGVRVVFPSFPSEKVHSDPNGTDLATIPLNFNILHTVRLVATVAIPRHSRREIAETVVACHGERWVKRHA